jgi:hypothetical protein
VLNRPVFSPSDTGRRHHCRRVGNIIARCVADLRLRKTGKLDACLAQLNLIAEQRNNIVHRWSYFRDQIIWFSNLPTTKDIAAVGPEPFKKADRRAWPGSMLVLILSEEIENLVGRHVGINIVSE